MGIFRRVVAAASAVVSCVIALAQGGGMGGIGGGMMGGMQGSGDPLPKMFPNRSTGNPYPYDLGQTDAKQLILSPNDRVEWTVSKQKGVSVFLFVTSEVFDPAVAIENSRGKVIAENDDQVPGDQSAFLSFTFPDDSDYKVVVRNYRSTGGGRFTAYTKFFLANEVGTSKQKYVVESFAPVEFQQQGKLGYDASRWMRLDVKKGEYYCLAVRNGLRSTEPSKVIGPTGVYEQDYRKLVCPGFFAFQALQTGEVYFQFSDATNSSSLVTTLNRLVPQIIGANSNQSLALDSLQMALVRHPIKVADDFVLKCNAPKGSYAVFITSPGLPTYNKEHKVADSIRKHGLVEYARTNAGDVDVVRRYATEGTAEYLVIGLSPKNEVSLDLSTEIETWDIAHPWRSSLKVGEQVFRYVNLKKHVLTKFTASASLFEPSFSLLLSDLSYFGEYVDRRQHRPATQFRLASDDAKVLFVISSVGLGGSGEFEVVAEERVPVSFVTGEVVKLDSPGADGQFVIKVEPGQRYRIVTNGTNGRTPITVCDEDFNSISTTWVTTSNGTTGFFTSGKSGKLNLISTAARTGVLFKIVKDETERLIPPQG